MYTACVLLISLLPTLLLRWCKTSFIPSRKGHIPPLEEERNLQKCLWMGYVSSQEGIYLKRYRIYDWCIYIYRHFESNLLNFFQHLSISPWSWCRSWKSPLRSLLWEVSLVSKAPVSEAGRRNGPSTQGVWEVIPRRFNSKSPLKKGRKPPKRKGFCEPCTIFMSGAAVKLPGV